MIPIIINHNDCWNFTGHISKSGYGKLRIKNKVVYAHRYYYENLKGKIPQNLQLDHLCRNRSCVNPDHLEIVDSKTNTMRSPIAIASINLKKIKCKNGHDYNKKNTLWIKTKTGKGRVCLICKRSRENNRYHMKTKELNGS